MRDPPSIKLRLTAKDHGLEAEGNGWFGITAFIVVVLGILAGLVVVKLL